MQADTRYAAAGDSRTTADLPVSTNAPPASARTTQEEAAAGRTAGLNGNAAPSTAVASQAEKSAATDASKGIGSQGNPAVPAQSAGKTANTGKHNGEVSCATCPSIPQPLNSNTAGMCCLAAAIHLCPMACALSDC